MKYKMMRDAIAVLMLSPLYFKWSLADRLDMVHYYIFSMEEARP